MFYGEDFAVYEGVAMIFLKGLLEFFEGQISILLFSELLVLEGSDRPYAYSCLVAKYKGSHNLPSSY